MMLTASVDEPARCNLLDDADEGSRPDHCLDSSCLTVGANSRGIVESSRDRGTIRLGIHADGREDVGEERSGIPVK